MASSSLAAVGSGLDIPTLVAQLVAAERKPAETRINNQGTKATTQLSALGNIKNSLSSLQSALEAMAKSATNGAYKTSISDTATSFSATVVTDSNGKTNATAGTYEVEVVRLAQSQKLSSGAFGADAKVGDGKLTFAWGEETLDVDIAEGSTLTQIAAAINKAAGGKGVNATIITANDGQHLVMNAVNGGTEGALTVTASGGNGGLSALTWDGTSGGMTENIAPANALVRVDGFERESSSNTITDLLPGVTLTLNKAEEGTKRTLTVAADNSGLKINTQAFVAAYNTTVGLLKSSSAYDATNDKASALTGDSLVRGLQQQLRGEASASMLDLKALGVTVNKDGTLAFSTTTFDAKVAEDPSAARKLLGSDGSFTSSLSAMLKTNLGSNGTLTLRTNSLTKQISKLEKDLDDLDARMEKVSARYTAQFTAMDTVVAKMQSTSDYLSQQISALNKKS
ncbi:flagellar filament capping protein FliD [Stenotrophomonas sp. STM01]|uniref:flagellar filament capping protein FliD n=1 Tax=Stenotrophomonas sp. STM01 TaxID=2769278 RepID=UPI001782E78E|nr:flagellar filament capping protein FliD [Stenotrophomonas sp. STM01]MBD9534362.1 flagellar filament capping protein FliD [Stenotrophomonas sp. STM01]